MTILDRWPLTLYFDQVTSSKMAAAFSLENEVFRDFAFYAAILGVKCLIMGLLTARRRIYSKVWCLYQPADLACRNYSLSLV